jgi:hypothetical protein
VVLAPKSRPLSDFEVSEKFRDITLLRDFNGLPPEQCKNRRPRLQEEAPASQSVDAAMTSVPQGAVLSLLETLVGDPVFSTRPVNTENRVTCWLSALQV